jgi:hypothetical protein
MILTTGQQRASDASDGLATPATDLNSSDGKKVYRCIFFNLLFIFFISNIFKQNKIVEKDNIL